MLKIRNGVFETNSSSTHSLILCSDVDWKRLEAGELFIDWDGEELITRQEAIEMLSKEIRKDDPYHSFYPTKKELEGMDDDYLERVADDWYVHISTADGGIHREMTTAAGEKIHALSVYYCD